MGTGDFAFYPGKTRIELEKRKGWILDVENHWKLHGKMRGKLHGRNISDMQMDIKLENAHAGREAPLSKRI